MSIVGPHAAAAVIGPAVGEPRLGPAQVLVRDSRHLAGGDAGIFHLAHSISDLYPLPSLLGMHSFHIGNKGGAGPGLKKHTGSNGGSNGKGVGAGGGQGGWNQHRGGHRHLGGQMSPQHWGGGSRGSGGGGQGGKNNRGVADEDVADVAAEGGGGRHYMWREKQIEQFTYLIRSGEGKRWWVTNDYEFEDTHNLTMAAAVDGNEDDGKNNSDDDDDMQTSSAWSNFIVRILILTLLLLA
jgi:hypothetical protein